MSAAVKIPSEVLATKLEALVPLREWPKKGRLQGRRQWRV